MSEYTTLQEKRELIDEWYSSWHRFAEEDEMPPQNWLHMMMDADYFPESHFRPA